MISDDGDDGNGDDCELTQHGTQNTLQLISRFSTITLVVNENITYYTIQGKR